MDAERFEVYGDAGQMIVDRRRERDVVLGGATGGFACALRRLRSAADVAEKDLAAGDEPSHGIAVAAVVAAEGRPEPDGR